MSASRYTPLAPTSPTLWQILRVTAIYIKYVFIFWIPCSTKVTENFPYRITEEYKQLEVFIKVHEDQYIKG